MSEEKRELTGYERSLVEKSISNYIETLSEKEDALEELKNELHVTQELDELITDIRINRKRLSEIIYKI